MKGKKISINHNKWTSSNHCRVHVVKLSTRKHDSDHDHDSVVFQIGMTQTSTLTMHDQRVTNATN